MSKTQGRITMCGHTKIPVGSRIEVAEGKYKGNRGIACQPIALIRTPIPRGCIGINLDEGGIGTLPEVANVRVSEIQIIK